MRYYKGDIFHLRDELIKNGKKVILTVPTNVGWKKDGSNVMGAGIAKQLKQYFGHNNYSEEYGHICQYFCTYDKYKDIDMCYSVLSDDEVIHFFATKPLNEKQPWLSWKQNSTMEQIEASMREFKTFIEDYKEIFLFPLVGSGNGGLNKDVIQEYLIKELKEYDNIILCDLYLNTKMLNENKIEEFKL